jgi:hypothetical protein
MATAQRDVEAEALDEEIETLKEQGQPPKRTFRNAQP